ncbi:MAG: hypothetical protein AB7P99_01590 [Vicinamibacterales bacterium]
MTLLLPSAASAQTPASQGAPAAAAHEVTVIGCLQREADFRAVTNAGRGGVLGSGIGVNDEYVLTDARPADTNRNSRMRPRAAAPSEAGAVGTSGSSVVHYSLTGKLEDNLLRDVGRLVEVVGTVEQPADSAALPRLTINVWHPVGDFCPQR